MFANSTVVNEQIKKCVRCGQCRSACPIFREYQTENFAPRGQVFLVQMIRDGLLEANDKVNQKLGDCLLCEACTKNCPSAIPVHELVAEARSYLALKHPSTARKIIFESIWADPKKLATLMGSMRLADRLKLRSFARITGLTKVLPGDLSRAEQIMNNIPSQPAHALLPRVSPARGKRKLRVAYFLGCGTDYLHPNVAVATVKVLNHLGIEVIIPEGIRCCGMPHVANGMLPVTAWLAMENALQLKEADVDFVISDCASCTSALNSPYYQVGGWQEIAEQNDLIKNAQPERVMKAMEWLRGKAIDVHPLLTDVLSLDSLPAKLSKNTRVTYHDPCHLAKAQKIKQQPRTVLQLIDGLDFVELPDPDACCGGSGTFALSHYDLSMKILDRKVEAIIATESELVATACPSCSTQIAYGLRNLEKPIRVVHPFELIAPVIN